MAQVGVSGATTRLICAEAGVPQSVFHYCFRSKDELFKQLTQTVISNMLGNAMDSVVEAATFGDSVRESLQQLWRTAVAHPDRQLVLYELTTAMLRDRQTSKLARWQYSAYFDDSRRLLQALAERSQMSWTVPLDVLSRMTTTMIDGIVLGWLTDHDTHQVSETIDAFAQFLAGAARHGSGRERHGSKQAAR